MIAASTTPLGDMQTLLARLYTDAAWLAAFEADPDGAARDLGREASPLTQIDLTRLRQFAQSLRLKRRRETQRLLPFTAAALGDGFAGRFGDYAVRVAATGVHRPLADAMAFVREMCAADDDRVRQAARFEWHVFNLTSRLVVTKGDRLSCHVRRRRGVRLSLAAFQYQFPASDFPVARASAWPRRPTLALFASAAGRHGIWYW